MMRTSSFFLSVTAFVLIIGTAQAQERSIDVDLDIPLFRASDDFSEFTAGVGWNVSWMLPDSPVRSREASYGIWTGDRRFSLETEGMWLLNDELNTRPIELALAFNIGFDLQRRPPDFSDDDPFGPPVEPETGSEAPSFLYGYRIAFTLESGVETTQQLESGWVRFGPGLRLLNRAQSGWEMLLPNVKFFYEGMHKLGDGIILAEDEDTPEWYSRLRLVQWHQINFGFAGLTDLGLAAGYQYTRDFGQPSVIRDQGFHSRFGWVADLSYIYRFTGEDQIFNSISLFARFTDGELAPFVETDRTFQFGLRF